MKTIQFVFFLLLLSAPNLYAKNYCEGFPKYDAEIYNHDDPALVDNSEDPLTVQKLQAMADQDQLDQLNCLFFLHAKNMASLPQGYSVGRGAQVLGPGVVNTLLTQIEEKVGNIDSSAVKLAWRFLKKAAKGPEKAIQRILVAITGKNWKGKIFFHGDNNYSQGLNRIQRTLLNPKEDIIPQGAFTTRLLKGNNLLTDEAKQANEQKLQLDSLADDAIGDLVSELQYNMVVLNYADPAYSIKNTNPKVPEFDTRIEKILNLVQVYDIMVAVPGKYGPIYVGKTWIGHYINDSSVNDGKFKLFDPLKNYQIAWYFLDYNEGALAAQETENINEVRLDPVPTIE